MFLALDTVGGMSGCRAVRDRSSFAVICLHFGQKAEEFPPLVHDVEMILHITPLRSHRAQSLIWSPLDELQTAEPMQLSAEVAEIPVLDHRERLAAVKFGQMRDLCRVRGVRNQESELADLPPCSSWISRCLSWRRPSLSTLNSMLKPPNFAL